MMLLTISMDIKGIQFLLDVIKASYHLIPHVVDSLDIQLSYNVFVKFDGTCIFITVVFLSSNLNQTCCVIPFI